MADNKKIINVQTKTKEADIQKKKRGILMIFKWMNESEINIEGDKIEITAPPRTDFFVEVLMNVKIEHKTVKNIRRGK